MLSEISVPWYLLSSAVACLGLAYYLRPRIAFRRHAGHHNDIHVLEIAVIFSPGSAVQAAARNAPASRSVELVIYMTLKAARR
jgi:hypothetical protein